LPVDLGAQDRETGRDIGIHGRVEAVEDVGQHRVEADRGDHIQHPADAQPPGVAGVARIASAAYPDPSAFDPDSKYSDPKSDPDDPRWWLVDVEFVEKFPEVLSLDALKAEAEGPLDGMLAVRRGQRLSVQPVDKAHFAEVLRMAKAKLSLRRS